MAETIEFEKPMDKRSSLVDRRRALRQVLCYICCAEFGTSSLSIHHKTCLKKHAWGLDANIAHADGITKKQAAQNLKKCSVPGEGPTLPIPSVKSAAEDFETYNSEALRIFFEHAAECLWCREKNIEALEAAREAQEAERRKAEEDEARRKGEEECALRRAAEEAEAHRLHEEEALRKALAEEEEHRLAEKGAEARRLATLAEAERLRRVSEEAEEARRMAAEEEAQRRAAEAELLRILAEEARRLEAEERHRRLVAKGQHKYLHKGEGKIAAVEAGKVHQEKIVEKAAREDIANFSLSHAKKEGLLVPAGGSTAAGGSDFAVLGEFEEPDASESRTKAASGASSTAVQLVEITGDLAKNWDAHWTAEQEEQFAQLRKEASVTGDHTVQKAAISAIAES